MKSTEYKALREEAGLTQEGAANLLGVSRRTVIAREQLAGDVPLEAAYALMWVVRQAKALAKGKRV